MSNIESAKARLGSAVDRLEEALGKMQASRPPADAVARLSSELETLRAERARLVRELDEARADNRRLREMTATVSGRLDNTIGDLKSMMGG